MKIKVYHVERDEYERIISPKIISHGYIKADKFDPEECHNLCNWFHWAKRQPKNLYSDIDNTTHGLVLYNPQTKEYWLALSVGWLHGKLNDIKRYLEDNWEKTIWNENEIDEPPVLEGVRVL